MGIPTLDGMGGVGEGAHAVHEYIVISELPRRALLLAGMIESADAETLRETIGDLACSSLWLSFTGVRT